MGLVLASESPLGHSAEGVCWTDFHDALCAPLTKDDILGLNPPYW